jgi:beta-phosphoglucomutase
MEEKMIKGVIFDLDGVIVHTDKYHYLAWKALADELGIYFDEVINNRLRGVSRMDSLDIVLERASKIYSDEEKKILAEKKNSLYVELLSNMSEKDVSEDVMNTLLTLKNRGYKIAIGSSSKNAKRILERVGLINMFDIVADGNDIQRSKPAPDVFLVAAKKLSLSSDEAVIVEDAIAGVEAGRAAGMLTFALGDASKNKAADHNLEILRNILEYLP